MTSHGSGSVLEVGGLAKRYGRVEALKNLNVKVESGQIYGFLGPNGAGKTTAIRIVLGLTPASGGSVKLFGQTPGVASRAKVGALVETPSAYAHLSGRDNLRVMARLRGTSEKQIPALLSRVGLADAATRPVSGYSLGMRGRLSLASALLGEPELLILDEPTNGLDPSGIREVRDLIRALPAAGHTVMLSSHLLSEIEQTASHVGIIAAGETRFQGRLSELQAQSEGRLHVDVDHPFDAQKLLATRPEFGDVQVEQHELVLTGPAVRRPELIADLNRILVLAGHRVSRLQVEQRTLEDLFLNLVERPAPNPSTLRPAQPQLEVLA